MNKLLLAFIFAVCTTSSAYGKSNRQPSTATYLLLNVDSGTLIDSSGDTVRPIASITKIMSVYVTLKENLDPDEVLVVTGKERSSKIRQGMKLTRDKLVELALVTSDNLAARTLAETYPGGYQNFIQQMNRTAVELGMASTHYVDATGLLPDNVSTPADLMSLILAVADFPAFNRAANTRDLVLTATVPTKRSDKEILVKGFNTNYFTGKLDILAAKTGYTSRAGRCLAMLFQQDGARYYLLVMGAGSSLERQKMVQRLIDKIK